MQKLPLSGASLKLLALVTMFADHINKGIIIPAAYQYESATLATIALVLKVVGRWAFPLFFFMLVEGFTHTSNKGKYLRNICIFALLSEIPFNLFVHRSLFDLEHQNIFFTHAIGIIVMWLISIIPKNSTTLKNVYIFIIVSSGCIVSELLGFDYGWMGIALISAFYILREYRIIAAAAGYALAMFEQPFSFPVFAILPLYNGERGKQIKRLFYWAYPVHLLLIAGLRMWLFAG